MPTGRPIDMAFIYVSDSVKPYPRIESAMIKALKKICQQVADRKSPSPSDD